MRTDKTLGFVKIKCPKCGHLNLIPVFEVLHVFEPVKCEKCGRVIAERKKGIRSVF